MKRTSHIRHAASAKHRARGWLVAALALMATVRGGAALAARSSDVAVRVEEYADLYRVDGEFETSATQALAFEVLTDYQHIGRFVRSVKTSAFEQTPDGRRVLRQRMVASTFLLRRTIEVALELREEPNHFVGFEDVLDRDFRAYTGHWSVETDSARTVVRYQLLARPRFPIPHVIGRGMMRSAAQDLLAQVRHEMARRSADPSPRVSEGSGAVAGTPARAATPAGSAPERSASEP